MTSHVFLKSKRACVPVAATHVAPSGTGRRTPEGAPDEGPCQVRNACASAFQTK